MKTNQKGFWAVASAPIISSVVARFSILLLSCLLWTSVGWGQTTQTFSYTGANQTFTVPAGVTSITVTATGAAGGGTSGAAGGKGAIITGTFSVTPGHVLNIIVGQLPSTAGLYGGGGGGGTYVWNSTTSVLLVVAGGGGGGSYSSTAGKDASITTTPTATAAGGGSGGTGTLGGSAISGEGGGGAGWTGNGSSATSGGGGGLAPPTSTGGAKYSSGTKGGFGGGGGGSSNGGGGGGGYAGGGGGKSSVGGGGGASYNAGTSPTSSVTNTGAGSVTITYTIPGCSGTPAAATISGATTKCSGAAASTLSLSTSYTLSGITYQWKSASVSGGPYTNLGTAATQSTGVLTATTYYICDITCSNSGLTYTTPEVVMTVNPLPTVSVNSGTYCSGGTALTLTASGASTYAWSPSTGLSAATGSSVNASPSNTTSYTVTGTDANGCVSTATSTVTLTLTPTAITISQSPASACNGSVATITASGGGYATSPSLYTFSTASSTYTSISGTTLSSSAIGDDVGIGNLPIGFSFPYNGNLQTVFAVSSNGIILLGNTSSTITGYSSNALSSTGNVLSPLWDDNNTTGGSIIYNTTGTAPNRLLTIQWTGMHVAGTGSATNPTIDMQALLYENGIIKFIYGSQSAALSSPTASIGISGVSGNYLSISPASPLSSSTASSSSENTSVNTTYLISGTNLIFTPPSATLSWSPTTNLYTNSAATTAYTNTSTATVYALNSTATTYTLTATNGACATSNAITTTISPLPTITLGTASPVCSGSTSTTLSYSATTGSPDQYSIDYDATANAQGFIDVNTYTTLNATPISLLVPANAAAGTYNGTITVKNSSTGCISTAYAFTVTINGAVSITTQPSNQVVLPNANATFSVTASGTGLTYQWEENSGSGWSAITNGGIYSGATTSSLTLTGVSSQNNNQYRVVVSGTAPCSALTSNAATLTISTTAISAQPQNQTICTSSGTASFSITTTGTTPTYQWQVSTNGGTTWTDISGETTTSLSLTGLVLANSTNQYRCSLNSGAVLSNAAILTVYDPPVITQQPSNLTVCANATSGSFSVTATGSNLTYQWQRSIDAGTTWSNITGATTSTLSFTSFTNSMDGYQYKVIVTGSSPCAAATSNVATLNVTGIVSVAASSATTCTNSAITLTATTTASASGLSYSWSSTTGSGASTPLTTNPASVTPTTAGTYTYTLATTGGSCSFSNTVGLTVNQSPSTLTLSPSAATNVCAGNIQSIVASGGALNLDFNVGVLSDISANLTSYSSYGMYFNNNNNTSVILKSIDVYPSTAGTLTIQLLNSTGTLVTSQSFTISSGDISTTIKKTLNVNFSIPANSVGWQLYYSSLSINRGAGTYTYPLSSSNFSITGNTLDGNNITSGTRYYFYNWVVNVPIQQTITWSPTTDLYTNATATTAYTGNPTTVYSKPTANRTYTATATTSNGCTSSASVTLNYVPTNTVSAASATPTLCINTALTSITHTTTGATGIGTATGLPAGVSAAFASNTITISGTPTASGTFNYSIPLTGGCGSVNATGTITVTANNTVAVASSTPSLCINSILTNITHTTTGATGIGTATGLPAGVSAAWANNTITISGTPTAAGTYAYTIPLSGGCGSVNTTGTITVNVNTASAPSATPTLCANTALTAITHTTTGATGISGAGVSGANTLPAGVSATWANNTITISGTPTAPGTFNYSIPLTGGCANVFATGTITVNQTNPPTGSSNQTLCTNATVADLNATGTNVQWFAAATGGSALAGTTALANGSHYFAEQTANACTSPTRLDVTVQLQNQWSGATSSDWSVGSNWSCGVVPNATDDALIPSTGITNLPNLSVNAGIKNISVGSTVILNGKTLTINGAISGTAAITGSANSGLVIAGAAGTINMTNTNTTDNVLNMLTINNGASATVGSNGIKMAPGGTVTVNGTLTLTGNLRLQSNASATARVAQSTGTITGALTQERYVPGKAIRKWSFLASPVSQSLASAWQQQIHITGAGTGGTMCNNYTISGIMTPHSNGFDVTQLQNPSFYTYDAATDNFVANTTGTTNYTLTPGVGYMVLVRGDRNDATNGGCVLLSANNQAAFTSTSVTLAATGAVGQGTITKVLPAGYSFIGNPYPCEIDFPSFNTTNASVISGGYWTYYPTNATYTFSTYNNGTSTNGGTQVIANGQSFLVNSTSGGTITFNEAHKSTTANNGNFRLTKTWDELIRVGLSNNQGNRFDEVVVRFGNDAAITKALNDYDAASVNGGDQWIKTLKETSELAIQTRPNTYQNDTVSLAMHAKNAGIYQLNFSEYQGLSNTEVYLIDQQENLIQNVKALPSYEFSVGANTTTANRFKLIFDAKTSGVAALATKAALQVYPNPTKDKVRITCDALAYGAYQIKVRTITGAEVLKAKGTYYQNEVIELSLQDLAAGMYMLELTQDNGLRAIQKITKQ